MIMGWYWYQIAQVALLVGFLALLVPFRKRCRFSVTKFIPATPAQIWEAGHNIGHITPETTDRHPMLPGHLVSYRRVSDHPEVIEKVFDKSGGAGTTLSTEMMEVLVRDEPRQFKHRLATLNGKPYPLGIDSSIENTYEAVVGGTRATHTIVQDVTSLWHWIAVYRINRKRLDATEEFFTSGTVKNVPVAPWWRSKGMLLSLCAVVGFTQTMGWIAGLLLSGMILLHELGHYAAMRLTGQPSVRIMLIPFFGGVAIPATPHKSRFDDAFCALMGAGLSAFLCAGLMLAYWWTDVAYAITLQLGVEQQQNMKWPVVFLFSASAMGLLNLVQLAPVLPLDGGHILKSILASFDGHWPRRVVLGLCFLAIAWLVSDGAYLIAALPAIGAMEAYRMGRGDDGVAPMRSPEIAAIGGGYLAVVSILITPVLVTWSSMGQLSPKTGYTELSDAEARQGSYEVEPRFNISYPTLEDEDDWSFVSGNRRTGGRTDLRVWGKPGETKVFGWVEIDDVGGLRMMQVNRAKLRREIADFASAQSANVIVAPDGGPIETNYGPVDSLPLSLTPQTAGKVGPMTCVAFHGLFEDGKSYVIGGLCRRTGETVPSQEIACLVNSIVIDGSATITGETSFACGNRKTEGHRDAALHNRG